MYAFDGTSIRELVVPSLVELDNKCFANMKSLEKLDLSACENGVLGDDFCLDCENLHEVIFPPHLCDVGWCAFMRCKKLTNIDIVTDEPVVKIPGSAFAMCYGLKEVKVNAPITIASQSFKGCRNLRKIDAPIKHLSGYDSFTSCRKLKELTFLPGDLPVSRDEPFKLSGVERIYVQGDVNVGFRKTCADAGIEIIRL